MGQVAYATPGTGTGTHLAGELLRSVAGIDIVHVPYRGSSPAQQVVIAGRVPLLFDVVYSAMPLVKAGKLKVIAVASPTRVSYAREYPTIAETFPEVSATSVIGIIMPSATPSDIIRRVSADVAKTLKSPDLAERMSQLGMEPVGSTPDEYNALIRAEIEKWGKVVKLSGAKASD
jgi:tripartite-type tricarboxylate transporter receptor subunit TctC